MVWYDDQWQVTAQDAISWWQPNDEEEELECGLQKQSMPLSRSIFRICCYVASVNSGTCIVHSTWITAPMVVVYNRGNLSVGRNNNTVIICIKSSPAFFCLFEGVGGYSVICLGEYSGDQAGKMDRVYSIFLSFSLVYIISLLLLCCLDVTWPLLSV